MVWTQKGIDAGDLDGLRLIGLGRVPRCTGCPRYQILVDAHEEGATGRRLPPVPAYCTHQICAPLATRYDATEARRTKLAS
ncbi:MAG: hypothetical protein ACYS0G_16735 [Planctomycetota bacterium]|jgi:hypothetical protein